MLSHVKYGFCAFISVQNEDGVGFDSIDLAI